MLTKILLKSHVSTFFFFLAENHFFFFKIRKHDFFPKYRDFDVKQRLMYLFCCQLKEWTHSYTLVVNTRV